MMSIAFIDFSIAADLLLADHSSLLSLATHVRRNVLAARRIGQHGLVVRRDDARANPDTQAASTTPEPP